MATVTIVCYYVTTIIFPIVLLSFLFPWRKRPPLDWSFIFVWASISSVLISIILLRRHWIGSIPPVVWMILWVNVAVANASVLYYIYRERFGSKFHKRLYCWFVRGKGKSCNFE